MMEVRFDAQVFRDAAHAITVMKSGVADVDLSPVQKASEYLESYGRNLDEFLEIDAATRCLLRQGGSRISKCTQESQLFAVVQEMVGSTRNITKANGKLDRTHKFLAELGRACP